MDREGGSEVSKHTETQYRCDNCNGPLATCDNNVAIVFSKCNDNIAWSRLRVTVLLHHGSHNNGSLDPAELCQECTYQLLHIAAERAKNGERVSAGVESPEVGRFK